LLTQNEVSGRSGATTTHKPGSRIHVILQSGRLYPALGGKKTYAIDADTT
jgi:hypothetical protein